MSIDIRFLNPRATCALCGRECDADGALLLEQAADPEVDVSTFGTQMLCDVTPGRLIVICEDCAAAD